MAELGFDFDPSTVPADDRNFDLLPSGQYEAEIVASEVVDTKSGKGRLLKLTWKIVTGAHENRMLWQNLNILHENPQAQDIGQKQLKGVCDALGVPAIRDTDDLHFKPAILVVGVQKNDPTRNEIKQVKALAAHQAPSSQPARTTAPPAARAASGGAPWRK